MYQYANIVPKSVYHGSNVPFLGVLLNSVVTVQPSELIAKEKSIKARADAVAARELAVWERKRAEYATKLEKIVVAVSKEAIEVLASMLTLRVSRKIPLKRRLCFVEMEWDVTQKKGDPRCIHSHCPFSSLIASSLLLYPTGDVSSLFIRCNHFHCLFSSLL